MKILSIVIITINLLGCGSAPPKLSNYGDFEILDFRNRVQTYYNASRKSDFKEKTKLWKDLVYGTYFKPVFKTPIRGKNLSSDVYSEALKEMAINDSVRYFEKNSVSFLNYIDDLDSKINKIRKEFIKNNPSAKLSAEISIIPSLNTTSSFHVIYGGLHPKALYFDYHFGVILNSFQLYRAHKKGRGFDTQIIISAFVKLFNQEVILEEYGKTKVRNGAQNLAGCLKNRGLSLVQYERSVDTPVVYNKSYKGYTFGIEEKKRFIERVEKSYFFFKLLKSEKLNLIGKIESFFERSIYNGFYCTIDTKDYFHFDNEVEVNNLLKEFTVSTIKEVGQKELYLMRDWALVKKIRSFLKSKKSKIANNILEKL